MAPGVSVVSVIARAAVELFSATRCSIFSVGSTREKAYADASEKRSIWAPCESAGVDSRSLASSAMCLYSGAEVENRSTDPAVSPVSSFWSVY